MGLRTGAEYLAGLRDKRQIVYQGRAVEDVTAEPGFRSTARAIAEFYDFQCLPELRDVMSYEVEDGEPGERAGMAFIEPRSKEDLRRRAAAYATWAEVTAGFIGRSPDYMNAIMMAVGAAKGELGVRDKAFGERAYNVYLDARRRDLCMTHTFVTPFTDRFKRIPEQKSTLRVVKETSDGVYVSGARAVATLAPFSDANLSIEAMSPKLEAGEEHFAIAFTVPVAAPGLRWICRDAHDQERSHFDAPLASKVDEMDCLAVFEECFLPWENVFIHKDVDTYTRQREIFRFVPAAAHQVLIKNVAKTRFMLGLGHLLAESTQTSKFMNVQERLGDFVLYLQNLESLAIAAVEGAIQDPKNGLWYANPKAITAGLRLFPDYYQKMVLHLMQIGGSGYINAPDERTLDALGEGIEEYFRGADTKAHDKVALFRMAWDLIGSTWGGRQHLYERFFFGDLQQAKARTYLAVDKSEAVEMVKRLLQPPAAPDRPFPLPAKYQK
jgi:4-hydroxyphenylacetate 3-monooxygenase